VARRSFGVPDSASGTEHGKSFSFLDTASETFSEEAPEVIDQ
jgi:hypothetical protein